MRLFDIVIPSYNNLDELKECLRGFNTQTIKNFHVWICIDGSTDDTIEYLHNTTEFFFEYSVLEHTDKKNHGRSVVRNLALKKLSSQYLIFLDSDLTIQSNFLEKHFSVLKIGDVISAGELIFSKKNVWAEYILQRGKHMYAHFAEIPFKYFESNNVGLPTFAFQLVNGFDENFYTYGGEDTELACRIWKACKFKTLYNKQAYASGNMNKSLSTALQQREEFAQTGLRYLKQKHTNLHEVFNLNFFESVFGKAIYILTPVKLVTWLANKKVISKCVYLKLVHLTVFCRMYRGYNNSIG